MISMSRANLLSAAYLIYSFELRSRRHKIVFLEGNYGKPA
jgi:hypothetical protein